MFMKSWFFGFLVMLAATVAMAAEPGYHLVNTYPLGGDGGWDYLTLDSSARRLYISRATHVIVMDADSGMVVGDIPDTTGVHGMERIFEVRCGAFQPSRRHGGRVRHATTFGNSLFTRHIGSMSSVAV